MSRLDPSVLRAACDPEIFGFETTADLEDLDEIIGQDRAIAAIQFGIGIGGPGFNIFAMGPSGIGKHHVLDVFLDERAPAEPTPPSWCYVHNFDDPRTPRAIALEPGRATSARDAVEELLREVEVAISAVIEGDEFRQRLRQLHTAYDARHEGALDAAVAAANERDLTLEQTQTGFAIIPRIDGEPAAPEQVLALDEDAQQKINEAREEVEAMLRVMLDDFGTWERDRRRDLLELQRRSIDKAVEPLFAELRDEFADSEEFVAHLHQMEESLVDDPTPFLGEGSEDDPTPSFEHPHSLGVERFSVNVIVDHVPEAGAPVVYQDDPTYENLHGRVEYDSTMGGLTTNFTLIRQGSLHRANGGYLVVDARKLLSDPQSWQELKRTLYAEEIRVPSRSESALAPRALSLDPDPIPLAIKVIVVGERETYFALRELDPDMDELFKVMADFETHMDRTPENITAYTRFIATIARSEGLRPFDCRAVARTVEEGSRMVQHARRLSTHMRLVADLLRASDYCAAQERADVVTATHIECALAAERSRNGRLRDLMLEEVTDGVVRVATDGEAIGEVNGLSVLQFGTSMFGRPARITAAVSPGREVIDIEREVDLGGPIHSKGVMLITGFLAHRYGGDEPLALSATIAFEQSYGPVDGDSASAAETCALLSAIADVPLRQSLALTGAIDQRGRVQAVGGVDAKIEGFFEVCAARGLTGTQGVVIPRTNVQSLMLPAQVIDAVERDEFSVFAVETIDEAMTLLTGLEAAELDERIRARLRKFAQAWAQSGVRARH